MLRRLTALPIWILVILAAAQPVAAAAERTAAEARTVATTLAELGHADGLVLDSAAPARRVVFPVPTGVRAANARLVLSLEAAFPDDLQAELQIWINDRPVATRALNGPAGAPRLELLLADADLARDAVTVDLRLQVGPLGDRCLAPQGDGGHVRVQPSSALRLDIVPAAIDTIEQAWRQLPPAVTIALGPGRQSADAFRAAWRLAHRLGRDGHEVAFEQIRSLDPQAIAGVRPDILIADVNEVPFILAVLNRPANQPLPTVVAVRKRAVTPPNGGVMLAGGDRRGPIVLTDPNAEAMARLLAGPFRPLAGATVGQADSHRPTPAEADQITFAQLGLATEQRLVAEYGEWQMAFTLTDLPSGRMPSELRVDIASPPSSDEPVLLYAYYNDVLVGTERLGDEPGVQHVVVPLPAHLTRLDNRLRLLVQRALPATSCSRHAAFPTQIHDTSAIGLRLAPRGPANFAELTTQFDAATQLFVPAAMLDEPAAGLRLLTALGRGLLRDAPAPILFRPDDAVQPNGPFVLVGTPATPMAETAIRFDRGRVLVTGATGETVLDVTSADLGVAQIVRLNGHHGLWLSGADGRVPAVDAVALDRGNVAFIKRAGVVLALDTTAAAIVDITYPDARTWLDRWRFYRYHAIGAVWILATLAVTVGLRRVYRARARDSAEG